MKKKIYLDYNATTPVSLAVKKAMEPFADKEFGNPFSTHFYGVAAKKVIEKGAEQAAKFFCCAKEEIIFTSGATESNNTILKGLVELVKDEMLYSTSRRIQHDTIKSHIITTKIEHHCVLETAKYLERKGVEVTYLGVDEQGFISLKELEKAIKGNTILVSIMYANNEVGTIEPIKAACKLVKSINKNIIFHTDAAQALHYLDCNVKKLGVDALSFSGHKISGPKGIGGFYLKKGIKIEPLLHGGLQQNGLRAGTENVAGIVGIGKAIEMIKNHSDKVKKLRNNLADKILQTIPDCWVNGPDVSSNERLPHNLNMSFPGAEGSSLLELLSQQGIAVSIGSACSARELKPSHVLIAMKLTPKDALCSIRFTLGEDTSKEDISYTVSVLEKAVVKMRKISGYNLK